MPDFVVPVAGKDVPLAAFRGVRVLLDFWRPTCGFSRLMAGTLAAAATRIGGVQFVSVTDAAADEAQAFRSRFRHVWPGVDGAAGAELFDRFRVDSTPTYYVLDGQGVIRATGHAGDWEAIRRALSEAAAPGPTGAARP